MVSIFKQGNKMHFGFLGLFYHKVPKFSDTRKLCCNLPKIQTKSPNLTVFSQEHASGIANSEDPDLTVPLSFSLIWVCTVGPNLSVQNFRVITVSMQAVLLFLK